VIIINTLSPLCCNNTNYGSSVNILLTCLFIVLVLLPFSKDTINTMSSFPLPMAKNKTSKHVIMRKKTQPIRKHSCLKCGKSFFKKHHLAVHNLTHTGALPFQCTNCSRRFRQQCHLGQHQIRHAGGEPPFKCINCTRTFWHHTTLVNHQRTYHRGQRPFRCDVCNSAFTQKMVLKRHFLTHRYEKPFSCIFCKKGFIQKVCSRSMCKAC